MSQPSACGYELTRLSKLRFYVFANESVNFGRRRRRRGASGFMCVIGAPCYCHGGGVGPYFGASVCRPTPPVHDARDSEDYRDSGGYYHAKRTPLN